MKKEKLKIVFFDIDGVVRPYEKEDKNGNKKYPYNDKRRFPANMLMDRNCIARVNKILEETGAKLVISSNWGRNLRIQTVMVALASNGLNGPYVLPEDVGEEEKVINLYRDEDKLHGVSFTPKRMSSEKCHEIGFWLNDYEEYIESYVIIDDSVIYPDYEDFRERIDRQVTPDKYLGLQDVDVEKAIEILNTPIKE